MASIHPLRLVALAKLRCDIFQTTYNPESLRTGAKYLKARLRGPSMVKYYPQKLDFQAIIRQFPQLEMCNEEEETRLAKIRMDRARGKGTPKKAKTKADSRRAAKKK